MSRALSAIFAAFLLSVRGLHATDAPEVEADTDEADKLAKPPRLQDHADRLNNFLGFELQRRQNRPVGIKLFFFAGALLAVVGGVVAGPVELEAKETSPPPTITNNDHWYFNLAFPGWMPFISG